MKIIVITPDWEANNQVETIVNLFEEGLECLHLRKPNYNKKQFKTFLDQIPARYHRRIIIHSIANIRLAKTYDLKGVHLDSKERSNPNLDALKISYIKLLYPKLLVCTTFRTQRSLKKASNLFDYIILNNIFKSRSDKKFKQFHDWTKLENNLKEIPHKVFARGGVTRSKLPEVRNLGFKGATIMNDIWSSDDPVGYFKEIKTKAKENAYSVEQ